MSAPWSCVVAATDLSPNAVPAIKRAAGIARLHGGALHVIHVVDPSAEDLTIDEALDELEQHTRDLPSTVTLTARKGRPFTEIVDYAAEVDASLVVAGAGGWHSIRARVVGTTVEQLVRHGDRPVLVVQAEAASDGYSRVLVGVDLSDASAQAVRFARAAFPDAHLTTMHVCVVIGERRLRMRGVSVDRIDSLRQRVVSSARPSLAAWLRQNRLPVDASSVVAGSPAHDLTELAEAFDLVVVGSSGMSGLRYVLLGSVAQRVLRDSSRDVLIVHADTRGLATPEDGSDLNTRW